MAKATKRRSPPKRKAPARSVSGLALSGWIVAAGFGAAWAGPQFGLWSNDVFDRVPSLQQLRQMASREDSAPPRRADVPPRIPPVLPEKVEARTASPPAAAATAAPKKPLLPPLKADTISEIVRKAEAKPSLAIPKPQVRTAPAGAAPALLPPPPVPAAIPFTTAAIRKDVPARAPTARPGDMAIRRYPFTTAPAVAYVGDLRTIRILGGEGDWKKVEVSATGVVGWLRLQRLGAARDADTGGRRATATSPVPAATLQREADAAGTR